MRLETSWKIYIGCHIQHHQGETQQDHPEWGQLLEMDWETCPDFEQGGQQISEQQLKRCEERGKSNEIERNPGKLGVGLLGLLGLL